MIQSREEYQVRRARSIVRCEFDRIAGAARLFQKAMRSGPRGDEDGDKTD